jgi:DNA-binding MarR family transcriptional regulator
MRTENNQSYSKFEISFQTGIKILNTSSKLLLTLNKLLKPHRLTFQQYYVLRVMCDTKNGVSVKDISSNMLDSNSNTSRLLDKLEQKQLVLRKMSDTDKRIVNIYLTSKGFTLVEAVTITLNKEFESRLDAFTPEEFAGFNSILDRINKVVIH